MQILNSIAELSGLRGPIFLAIGVFDGVHRGHRAVIARAVNDAAQFGGTAVVVTFDPHPARVLRPDLAPKLLTATKHKIELLRALDVPALLIIPFDAAFAASEPADFIRALWQACAPLREICVGHEWSFGRHRSGNLELMRKMGDDLGFDEVGISAVKIGDEIVSSTLIRQAIQEGNFPRAEVLLGREYTVLGTVIQGAQLGRTIGFPTANLAVHSEQLPPNGVYAVQAEVDSRRIMGVINIGERPTVTNERTLTVEVHLLDFEEDVYGKDLEITFRKHLRDEQRFTGLEALREQIARDVLAARAVLQTCE